MVQKVLIANRGEIAIRIARTCHQMGIQTVGLYAEGEEQLPHRFACRESVCLGSGPLAQTYLNQNLIIKLAKEFSCDALHPGYGLLSENATFAKKVGEAGLIFIGPRPESMSLMGDKKTSKIKIQQIGVPSIPGYHGDDQSLKVLSAEAKKIGLPLMIKASAGGGGKGMRVIRDLTLFQESLESCQREALNSFGDKTVLLEKFIENPRHIEVQVFGDGLGQAVHLFERECSIQRRHQKILEETPSCALSEKLRQSICQSAIKIAENITYLGAGTIEFILDDRGNFYFLEMNTRLQVEHPITEAITGLDLVEWQIRLARGEGLPKIQSEILRRGHAIEVRLYAEDPDNQFLPAIGQIDYLGNPAHRFDRGISEGNTISTSYDPMIGKLTVWGEDREHAIAELKEALKVVGPLGPKTNREYLLRIISHPQFIAGKTFTHFVDTYRSELGPQPLTEELKALAIASLGLINPVEGISDPWISLVNFRN